MLDNGADGDAGAKELDPDEMEKVFGGGDIIPRGWWGILKCQAGFHDYYEQFEHKPYCGTWILSRCVSTCRR